ncbi:tetratricopeptide repeat protein [Streptomyces formicae]|uniref:Tetratricopeptide repeat protein n=1 Tax=Streptomyces formicae TaxID=1616117 RepID=A0ABY3WFS7_9ACTN|nr:tetratricopeptide repeat protein [Streptomyces formicae]UNM10252.1 tetratricopeptide repeat protein [Streptomyces formicae]
MKRGRLWTGLVATAAVAAGVVTWAALDRPDATSDSAGGTPDSRRIVKANSLLEAGLLQAKYQDYTGAAGTFREVVELDPGNKLAWYNLGVIAQRDGRKTDARVAYEKALKTDPKFAPALFNEAVLFEPSEPDRAIKLLKRAVAANPKASTAYLHLGQVLAKKDRDDEARDAFRRAVAVDPALHRFVPEPFKDSASPSPTSSQAGANR